MNPRERRHLAPLRAEIDRVIAEHQPLLRVAQGDSSIIVEGSFLLLSSEGPFDQWQARVEIGSDYPRTEPTVFETAGRIPRNIDRHVYPSTGACCIGVWEHWLATAPDSSILGFITGPVHEFFLGQWWFERERRWRFGEWSHGSRGIVEAYAEAMRVTPDLRVVVAHLELLSQEWPKGHWLCPCGSGLRVRQCHQSQIGEMHSRIAPQLARQMLSRLASSLQIDRRK